MWPSASFPLYPHTIAVRLLAVAITVSEAQNTKPLQTRRQNVSIQHVDPKQTGGDKYTDGVQPRCPKSPPDLVAQVVEQAIDVTYSGCAERKWTSLMVPGDIFNNSCDQRDDCYAGCQRSFEQCNDSFLADMVKACQLESMSWDSTPFSYDLCVLEAQSRRRDAEGNESRQSFKSYNEERCVCDCKGAPKLCGDKCVNIEEDDKHCGSCDHVCGPGLHCDGGKCTSVLAPPESDMPFDERLQTSTMSA